MEHKFEGRKFVVFTIVVGLVSNVTFRNLVDTVSLEDLSEFISSIVEEIP